VLHRCWNSNSKRQILEKATTGDGSYAKPAINPKTSYYYSQRQLLIAKPATRKTNYSQIRQLLEKAATREGSYYSQNQLLLAKISYYYSQKR
jgi:hypothetical protein